MYVDNPNLEKPEDENATIYRYMDFIKRLSLIDKKLFSLPELTNLTIHLKVHSQKPM